MAGFGWIDTVLMGLLLASAVIGALRGLVVEVLSMLGWLVAWIGARTWGAGLPGLLGLDVQQAWWTPALGYALSFVALLFAWRLLTWLVGQVIKASPLAPVDRGLGAAFGALRGLLIVLALVYGLGLTPLAGSAAWRAAPTVQWTQVLLGGLAAGLPARQHRF